MPYRKINKGEKRSALDILESNDRDFILTSQQLGISERTLRRWDEEKSIAALGVEIPELLEGVIKNMLNNPPEFNNGQGWALAIGILVDKLLLVKGKATSRHESISSKVSNMTDEQYAEALNKAEELLNNAKNNLSVENEKVKGAIQQ